MPPIKTVGHLPDLSHVRTDVDVITSPQKRTKRTKGWDGESATPSSPEGGGSASPTTRDSFGPGPSTPSGPPGSVAHVQLDKTYETVPAPDGSAAVHAVVRCTLADLARATNLRVEDAAFALNECGLLVRRDGEGEGESEGEGDAMTIAISREMVEAVAKERNVKRMCIDFTKVLL